MFAFSLILAIFFSFKKYLNYFKANTPYIAGVLLFLPNDASSYKTRVCESKLVMHILIFWDSPVKPFTMYSALVAQ